MKMKKFSLLVLAGLLLVGTGCEKEPSTPDTPVQTANSCDYMTYSVGTEVTFRTVNGNETTVFTGTKELGGNTWFEGNKGGVLGYYRCAGDYFYITDAAESLTMRAMKVNAKAGDTWTDSKVINGVDSDYKRTIVSVDGKRTVEGTEYTDVAVLDIVATFTVSGFPGSTVAYTEYYSKTVGFLESDIAGSETTLISRKN